MTNEYNLNVKTIGYVANNSAGSFTIRGDTTSDETSFMATTTPASSLAVPPSLGVFRTAAASDGTVTAIRGERSVNLRTTTNGLCLDVEGEGGTCAPLASAGAGRLLGVSICAPNLPLGVAAAYGVVPNGVTSVVVRNESGGVVGTAPVQNNAFRVVLAKAALAGRPSLTWEGRPGRSALAEVLPSGLGCA